MTNSIYYRLRNGLLLGVVVLFCHVNAKAAVHLPYFFGSNMVLQRDKPIKLWGTANAGSTFSIVFAGKAKKITADKNGKWNTVFEPLKAGGPYDMQVQSDSSYTFHNIMMGDVWLCSGQSNMEWPMLKTFNAAYELQHADIPAIRCLTLVRKVSSYPLGDISPADWKVATPQDTYEFSAVAFFFAKRLYERYHIPIGIIHSSWGGTAIEAWTSFDSISSDPDFTAKAAALKETYRQGKTMEALQQLYADSVSRYEQMLQEKDSGYLGKWYEKKNISAGWKSVIVPSLFTEELAAYKGSIWLRKTFTLPATATGTDLVLNMETLNEKDITWINGTNIGNTQWSPGRRTYRIPKALLHEGENYLTIRLESTEKVIGFQSRNAAEIRLDQLYSTSTPVSIPLAGEWLYHTGLPLEQYPATVAVPGFQANLAVLYNAMIAPFKDLAIKGFTWYQGEANAGRAFQYRRLLPMMIRDWRNQFKQGDLPFMLVQLSGYGGLTNEPVESGWAELREAQQMTLAVPATGMAVSLDVGNPYDVHPTDKQTVGRRLAAAAEKMLYGDTGLQTSPLYTRSWISNDTVHIKVSNAVNGLISRGAVVKGFSIAGPDKHFVWASAVLRNDEILVWDKRIPHPVEVRYAWANSPVESNGANVYNREGYPLGTFRTGE